MKYTVADCDCVTSSDSKVAVVELHDIVFKG